MIEVLDRIRAAGGDVAVVGGDLRLRVPRGLLSDQERRLLAEHKAEIVRLLADEEVVVTMPKAVVEPDLDQQAEPVEFTTPEGMTIRFAEPEDEEEIVVPPPPCQQCGSLMLWQDFSGKWHCQYCEPAVVSERLLATAARLRGQKIRT
jgi:hypothetical protein